jgi:serine/threonine protein kinase
MTLDESHREVGISEADYPVLLRYLRKALIVDPSKRPSTKELLSEEWVAQEVSVKDQSNEASNETSPVSKDYRLIAIAKSDR